MSPRNEGAANGGQNGWVRSNLAAIASAAVLSVYAAGFVRTREAAARFADEDANPRRPMSPRQAVTGPHSTGVAPRSAAPSVPANVQAGASAAAPPARDAGSGKRDATTPTPTATVAATPAAGAAPAAPVAHAAPAPAATGSTNTPAATVASAAPTVTTPAPAAVTPAPAPAPAAATKTAAADSAAAAAKENAPLKDGLFYGWGTSRHGDIQAAIETKDGKILSAYITACLTQYSCSWIEALPEQVVQRQSAETDYVTGATQSSNAFYGAIVQALKKAR